MKPTARQRVLAFIERQPGSSPGEIGRGLKMSAATVRHHLAVLRSDGRIVRTGESRVAARGRPAIRYRPSDRLLGDNLAQIAESLLEAYASNTRPRPEGPPLRALVDGLLGQLGPPRDRLPVMLQLRELTDALNQIHYMARWEAGAEGPRIVFGHCPYAAIIERHPELCQMDRLALGEHMQAAASQIAKIDPRSYAATQCVFVLGPRPASQPGARQDAAKARAG